MSIANEGMAARAGSLIERWGGPAYLLRGAELRPCVAAFLQNTPRARGLNLEGWEQVLIAAPLDIPPDHEQDKFVTVDGRLYDFVAPIKGPRPAVTTIYFDASVVFVRDVNVESLA